VHRNSYSNSLPLPTAIPVKERSHDGTRHASCCAVLTRETRPRRYPIPYRNINEGAPGHGANTNVQQSSRYMKHHKRTNLHCIGPTYFHWGEIKMKISRARASFTLRSRFAFASALLNPYLVDANLPATHPMTLILIPHPYPLCAPFSLLYLGEFRGRFRGRFRIQN
jgi:hypothetical protein